MACGAEQEDNSGAMITKSPALSTLLESWRTKKTGGGLKVAFCVFETSPPATPEKQ